MCATQMNTSDNPGLWDIQLSSWLFCELTRQLCPWLMANSCYFFASHTMHAGNFLQASAGRLLVTEPRTSDQQLGRLPVSNTAHMCISQNAQSLWQAIIHWQPSDSRSWHLQPLGLLLFPTRGNTELGQDVYSVTSCTQSWSPHTIPAWNSPWNFSASH